MEINNKKENKKESSCLTELKKEYEVYKKKYNLPNFEDINRLFDIEELDSESDFLIRKIRRFMSEKLASYMRFVEVLLNPSNAPMFFFKLIKKLENSDKEELSEIYEYLGKLEIQTITLDLDYNEEKEAEFINKLYKTFNEETRGKLQNILKKLSNGENGKAKDNGSSYFG